jgi:hypothetical protein
MERPPAASAALLLRNQTAIVLGPTHTGAELSWRPPPVHTHSTQRQRSARTHAAALQTHTRQPERNPLRITFEERSSAAQRHHLVEANRGENVEAPNNSPRALQCDPSAGGVFWLGGHGTGAITAVLRYRCGYIKANCFRGRAIRWFSMARAFHLISFLRSKEAMQMALGLPAGISPAPPEHPLGVEATPER